MIIGLTGPQRAGKTTVYDHLEKKHDFVKLSIAQEIKNVAHELIGFSFSDEEKDKQQLVLNMATPRDLYIYVGQMDEFQNDLWVKRMFAGGYQGPGNNHVIESVGKPFQWLAILKFAQLNNDHCMIFDVMRPEHEYRDSRSAVVDFVPMLRVENSGSMEELYDDLDNIYVPSFSQMRVNRTEEEISNYARRIEESRTA